MLGFGVVTVTSNRSVAPVFQGTLANFIIEQGAITDWKISHLPIAETPEMKKAVGEVLNYDDAIFVNYTKGISHFAVYVAYWKPGKMSHRLIAGHTPDVCWTASGWAIMERETIYGMPDGISGSVVPGKRRIMVFNSQTEHVVFWHLVDGEVISYSESGRAPWYAIFSDVFSRALNQRQEQFFIRISSDLPVHMWPGLPPYNETLRRLSMLHLRGSSIQRE